MRVFARLVGPALVLLALAACGQEQKTSFSLPPDEAGTKAEPKPDARALLDAVNARDAARVKALLERGADPNAKSAASVTPLVAATMAGDTEIMRLLLKAGANPELKAKEDITPLLAAVTFGGRDAVQTLLEGGARIDGATSRGVTPLMQAVLSGQGDIAELLLERGADVNARNSAGSSILILAITMNQEKLVCQLIDKGADVNVSTNQHRSTPLMMASHKDMHKAAERLLAKGARTDTKDAYGKTALDYAKSDAMKRLLNKGSGNGDRPPK